MNWLLRFLCLIALCVSAEARAIALKGPSGQTIKVAAFYAYTKVQLCLIPDTQNQTSQDDEAGPIGGCTATSQCLAPYCTTSPYCDGSWTNTGRTHLRNQAFAMMNQWSRVDWTRTRGRDTAAQSFLANSPDGHHCDAILSLGDISDVGDATVALDPDYATLFPEEKLMWDLSFDVWSLIKSSGIPSLPVRGNHDPRLLYRQLMETVMGGTAMPFYYARESTRLINYAILFPTNSGHSFCALALNSSAAAGTAVNNTERQWIADNIGCGAGLPTILIQHEAISATGTLAAGGTPSLSALVGDAANNELFLIVGGHYVPTVPGTVSAQTTGAGGFDYWNIFSDYQEMNRHDTGAASSPQGATPSDGAGDYYTIVTIDPRYSTMIVTPFSPYWQRLENDVYAGATVYTTAPVSYTMPFTTRFP